MKDKVRFMLAQNLAHLPAELALAPYSFALFILKKVFSSKGFLIWDRNSIRLGDAVPGVSDLDITIISSERHPIAARREVEKEIRYISFALPVLGEINCYSNSHLSIFLPIANPLELARDPELLARFDGHCRPASPSERLVFALRFIESDANKFIQHFSFRLKKIARFFNLLQIDSPKVWPLPHLMPQLILDNFPDSQRISSLIEQYLAFDKSDPLWPNQFYQINHLNRLDFLIYLPQFSLAASLHHEMLDDDLRLIKAASSAQLDIFHSQLAWEAWGFFGQMGNSQNPLEAHFHLEKMHYCLKFLDYSPSLTNAFAELIELHKAALPT
jgi:hypothetical protein